MRRSAKTTRSQVNGIGTGGTSRYCLGKHGSSGACEALNAASSLKQNWSRGWQGAGSREQRAGIVGVGMHGKGSTSGLALARRGTKTQPHRQADPKCCRSDPLILLYMAMASRPFGPWHSRENTFYRTTFIYMAMWLSGKRIATWIACSGFGESRPFPPFSFITRPLQS